MEYSYYYLKDINEIDDIDASKIICFDTETTGLNCSIDDEILSISLIDGNYNKIFDKLFKPEHHTEWKEAQKVNHISPKDVENCGNFKDYAKEVEKIFEQYDLVVAYNLDFDEGMLNNYNIKLPSKIKRFDVMKEFAAFRGKFSNETETNKYVKLEECAAYYDYYFDSHISLNDTSATLHCFYSMLQDDEEPGYIQLCDLKISEKNYWLKYRDKGYLDRPFINYETLLEEKDLDIIKRKLNLPLTTDLIYWEWEETTLKFKMHKINKIKVIKAFKDFCIVECILDNGNKINIHNAYLCNMQTRMFALKRTSELRGVSIEEIINEKRKKK